MYEYPNYAPQTVGDFRNPRGTPNMNSSPVPAYVPVTAGMYDSQPYQYPSQTVGQMRGVNPAPNFVPAPMADGMQTYALGDTQVNQSTPINDFLNRSKETLGQVADTAGAAWGKMSFGQKGTAVLGAASSLYGAYNAHKSGKLAKEQFAFEKESFNKNFEASAKTTNAALSDRQATRVARDPNAYASVSDYMKKYGV